MRLRLQVLEIKDKRKIFFKGFFPKKSANIQSKNLYKEESDDLQGQTVFIIIIPSNIMASKTCFRIKGIWTTWYVNRS